ncbi:TFIIB-type zinc ribbon-containing protein [Roseobacteraceae bacterium NS-SX3]
MKCPIDGTELKMADRAGVEIDYCPQCRGVWLDRGELDKIIERSSAQAAPAPGAGAALGGAGHGAPVGQPGVPYKKKKRGGFLEDLFDF